MPFASSDRWTPFVPHRPRRERARHGIAGVAAAAPGATNCPKPRFHSPTAMPVTTRSAPVSIAWTSLVNQGGAQRTPRSRPLAHGSRSGRRRSPRRLPWLVMARPAYQGCAAVDHARVETPSLQNTPCTWVATVHSLMWSWAAICLLRRPSATSVAIWNRLQAGFATSRGRVVAGVFARKCIVL